MYRNLVPFFTKMTTPPWENTVVVRLRPCPVRSFCDSWRRPAGSIAYTQRHGRRT